MFSIKQYISEEQLVLFCKKNHIKKLSLFGSALCDELGNNNDIDLLVEFEEGHVPGLITFCGMENELTERINQKIDLRTPGDLSRYFRDKVVTMAKVLYAAG